MRVYKRGKVWWASVFDPKTRETVRKSTHCTDEVAARACAARFEREMHGHLEAGDGDTVLAPSAPSSFIYFIRAGFAGPIKVGRSLTPAFRVDRLQTAAHEELRLLGVIPGGSALERVIHRGLKFSIVRGEWFEPTPLLLKLIKELFGVTA